VRSRVARRSTNYGSQRRDATCCAGPRAKEEALAILLVGGVIYSGGVALHLSDRRRYHCALWHG
jgi:hypothetical protein